MKFVKKNSKKKIENTRTKKKIKKETKRPKKAQAQLRKKNTHH